jgi:hypothetical protein
MLNFCIKIAMYSFKLQDQIWAYEDIDCQFVVCQNCFWAATIFNSAKKVNSQNKSIKICPICSADNISMYPIFTRLENHIIVFGKIRNHQHRLKLHSNLQLIS